MLHSSRVPSMFTFNNNWQEKENCPVISLLGAVPWSPSLPSIWFDPCACSHRMSCLTSHSFRPPSMNSFNIYGPTIQFYFSSSFKNISQKNGGGLAYLDPAVVVTGEGLDGTTSGLTALIKSATEAISHNAGVDLRIVFTTFTPAAVLGNILLGAVLGLATVRSSGHGCKGDREEEGLDVHVCCCCCV